MVANGGTAIAITGREGMTGASVIMGNDNRVPHETHMQIAGSGQHISTQQLRPPGKPQWTIRVAPDCQAAGPPIL